MATKVQIPSPLTTITGGIDAFDDLAGWIAEPPEGRPLAASIGRSGQAMCNFYGATPSIARPLFGPAGPIVGLLCQPYYDKNGYDAPTTAPPPFNGGQCDNQLYEIPCYSNGADPATVFQYLYIRGPVTNLEKTRLNSFQVRLRVYGRNGTTDEKVANHLAGQEPGFGPFRNITTGVDNCGDPPGGGAQPGANPPPTPPAFPAGEEPGVDPDGQPFFFVPPIEPSFPGDDPVPVPPPTQPGGDSPSAPPGDGGGESGTGSGDGGGDTPFDEPPENERWVGCCVTLDFDESRVGVITASLPDPVYPRVVGNARLLFEGGAGAGADTPIRIESRNFCLWEPVRGLSPTGVRVTLLPDISYTVRKYSVPLEN